MAFKLRPEKTKRVRSFEWFLYTQHTWTNNLISNVDGVQRENDFGDVRCGDGKIRQMWRVPRSVVVAMLNAKKEKKLVFSVWVREGNGLARKSIFDKINKLKKAKKKIESQSPLF